MANETGSAIHVALFAGSLESATSLQETYYAYKPGEAGQFKVPARLDLYQRLMVMAFAFKPNHGHVMGWVAFGDPAADHGDLYGSVGPVLDCELLTVGQIRERGFQLTLTDDSDNGVSEAGWFPEEGYHWDTRYSDGRIWTPVVPDRMSCTAGDLAAYEKKRRSASESPVLYTDELEAKEREMLLRLLESGEITQSQYDDFAEESIDMSHRY